MIQNFVGLAENAFYLLFCCHLPLLYYFRCFFPCLAEQGRPLLCSLLPRTILRVRQNACHVLERLSGGLLDGSRTESITLLLHYCQSTRLGLCLFLIPGAFIAPPNFHINILPLLFARNHVGPSP